MRAMLPFSIEWLERTQPNAKEFSAHEKTLQGQS